MRAPHLGEFDYVLRRDRELPKTEQTVFRLQPLTFAQQAAVARMEWTEVAEGETRQEIDAFGKAREVLEYGLRGWDNLLDSEGKPVDFRVIEEGGRRKIPNDLLDLLVDCAIELSNAITRRTRFTEELAKNSTSP